MKLNKIFLFALIISASLGFTSCGSDKDDNVTPEEKVNLTVDVDTVKIDVGGTSELNIKTGGSPYKMFLENSGIVTATQQGSKISFTSLVKGKTAVIISDAKGNYKRIPVLSMYMKLSLDKEKLSAKIKLGNTQVDTIKVFAGNGDYQAAADADIAKVSVDGDKILVTSVKGGSTVITVTDMMGLTTKIPLVVETTTVPYTDAELATLKSSKDLHYTFNGYTLRNADGSDYSYYNKKDGELLMFGYNYYDYMYLKLWFSGDKSIGKKANAKIAANFMDYTTWETTNVNESNINFEIIQNDGTLIWAVYSFVKDNKLYYGNFCQKINAE